MDILLEDRNTLPKYTSDVYKWHFIVSNLTKDIFDCLKTTFEMDFVRSLRFQQLPDEPASASEVPSTIALSVADEVLKGSFLSAHVQ